MTKAGPYKDTEFPHVEIPDEVTQVFAKNDMVANAWKQSHGHYTFELWGCTDGGMDIVHSLLIEEKNLAFLNAWCMAFYKVYESFSPWNEAWVYCNENGNPQNAPFDSGDELYGDLKNYRENTLGAVLKELIVDACAMHQNR